MVEVYPYQLVGLPWSIQPFHHNTPTLQTLDRQDGPVAQGEPLLVTVAPKIVGLHVSYA